MVFLSFSTVCYRIWNTGLWWTASDGGCITALCSITVSLSPAARGCGISRHSV